jgi:hypothetical protein
VTGESSQRSRRQFPSRRLTGGAGLTAGIAPVKNNARLGAEIAKEYAGPR